MGFAYSIPGQRRTPPDQQNRVYVMTTTTQECACHLYDAEVALHAAHQTGNDVWIDAANAKLHIAVTEYLATLTEVQR